MCHFRTAILIAFFSSLTILGAEKNIVLFVADDHSPDAGCYGNNVIQTPHLDTLASNGTRFTNAFATTASCSASRSVILTGLYNHRNGQYGHQHDFHHFSSFEEIRSLPALLSEAGYRTASIGKYHVAPESVYPFDQFLPGSSRNPVEMARNCRDFLEDQARPFFLYFCTSDPHRGGGKVGEGALAPDRFGNRPQGYDGITEVTYRPEEVIVPPFLPDNETTRLELAQYYQSISRIDQGLGSLIALLKETGQYEDTLILYISDHGMAFPGAKTTVYEPGLRSPCIVRNPYNQARGVVNDALINWADLTPTLLDFAGVSTPRYRHEVGHSFLHSELVQEHGLHGRSFLEILEEENPEGWDRTYASHTFHEIQMYYPMRVVRTRDYKLIWNVAHPLPFPFASDLWAASTWQRIYREGPEARYGPHRVRDYIHRPEFELYDLKNDPWESTNLAEKAEYQAKLEELLGQLKEFQRNTQDPWYLKWLYE